MSAEARIPRILIALIAAACVVVLVAGLKDAQDIALPVVFSLFLSVLAWPPVREMMKRGVPKALAIAVVMLIVSGLLVGSTAIVGDSVARFTASIPQYQAPLEAQLAEFNAMLVERLGRGIELESLLDPGSMLQAVRTTATTVVGILGNVVIVVIMTTILLLEASELGHRIQAAFPTKTAGSSWLAVAAHKVQRYLALKTIISLVTGVLLGVWTAAFGLDFAIVWGLIAFVLNFVPAVGSIIAAIPAVALALVQLGPGYAVAIGLGYFAVNMGLGNFLEPRIMGRRLGLSPFVVILSLVFWGYVWGPGGMLVGVPLTVILKLILEASPSTRWIAVLIGGADEVASLRADQVSPFSDASDSPGSSDDEAA